MSLDIFLKCTIPPIRYADLPEAFKFFIEAQFRTIDVDGDGSIGRIHCADSDSDRTNVEWPMQKWPSNAELTNAELSWYCPIGDQYGSENKIFLIL